MKERFVLLLLALSLFPSLFVTPAHAASTAQLCTTVPEDVTEIDLAGGQNEERQATADQATRGRERQAA